MRKSLFQQQLSVKPVHVLLELALEENNQLSKYSCFVSDNNVSILYYGHNHVTPFTYKTLPVDVTLTFGSVAQCCGSNSSATLASWDNCTWGNPIIP